jgi:hypothetical protein
LTKKEKEGFKNISIFYKKVENKCIKEEILNNKMFAKKFDQNFENISSLKEKFFIEEKRKIFLKERFSLIDKIFYLQENVSLSDIKNFEFFIDEVKKSFDEENNLENMEI